MVSFSNTTEHTVKKLRVQSFEHQKMEGLSYMQKKSSSKLRANKLQVKHWWESSNRKQLLRREVPPSSVLLGVPTRTTGNQGQLTTESTVCSPALLGPGDTPICLLRGNWAWAILALELAALLGNGVLVLRRFFDWASLTLRFWCTVLLDWANTNTLVV